MSWDVAGAIAWTLIACLAVVGFYFLGSAFVGAWKENRADD